jgi:hypothetical protein
LADERETALIREKIAEHRYVSVVLVRTMPDFKVSSHHGVKEMKENNKTEMIILTIGVLVGGGLYLANSLFLYYTSIDQERSDIAEGLYLDVSSLNETLIATDQEFLSTSGDKNIFVQATSLYPDNGLYFAYQRDIPRLDRHVAENTVTFYNHVLSAERARSLIFEIQRLGDARELTSSELRRQQILTESVAADVNMSVMLLPALKQELDAATG